MNRNYCKSIFQISRWKQRHPMIRNSSDSEMYINPSIRKDGNSCPESSSAFQDTSDCEEIDTEIESIDPFEDNVTERKRERATRNIQQWYMCESDDWHTLVEPELVLLFHSVVPKHSSTTSLLHPPLDIMLTLKKMYLGGVPGCIICSLAIVLSSLLSTTSTSHKRYDDNLESDTDDSSNETEHTSTSSLTSHDTNTFRKDEELYIASIQHLGRFLMIGSSHHDHSNHGTYDFQIKTTCSGLKKQKMLTIYGLLALTASNPIFREIPLLEDSDLPSQLITSIDTVLDFCTCKSSAAPSASSVTLSKCHTNEECEKSDRRQDDNELEDFIPENDFDDSHSTNRSSTRHQNRCIQNEKLLFVLWEIRSVCRNLQMVDIPIDDHSDHRLNPTIQASNISSELVLNPSVTVLFSASEEMDESKIVTEEDSIIECDENTDCLTICNTHPTTSSLQHTASTDLKLQGILMKFRELYGFVDFQVLVSIAYVARSVRAYDRNRQTIGQYHEYNESLLTVADFLCDRKHARNIRLACLQIFFLSTDDQQELASNVERNGISTAHSSLQLEDALLFCTNRRPRDRQEQDWEVYLQENNSIIPLLWEIRAICLNMRLQQRLAKKRRRSFFMPGVVACNKATHVVTSGTVTIERSIHTTTNLITSSIDAASDYIVRSTSPSSIAILDAESTITQLALSCTSSVLRASDQTRSMTSSAISGLKEVSRTGIRVVAHKMNLTSGSDKEAQLNISHCNNDSEEKNDYSDDDDDDGDEPQQSSIVTSAGQLGLVTIGAMVIVGDAIGDSATKVMQHTSHTAADIVAHKFGPSAGQVIRDVADTTGNVFDTMKHVAFLVAPIFGHGQGVARMVVKDTSKTHVNNSLYVDATIDSSYTITDADTTDMYLPDERNIEGNACSFTSEYGSKRIQNKLYIRDEQKAVERKESTCVSDDETLADSLFDDDPDMIIEVKAIGCI